jgi:ankyrin repeat protein
MRLLLKKDDAVDAVNGCGLTPLLSAAEDGLEDIEQILLEYSASKEIKDKSGQTPLRHAIINKHENVVRLFLEKISSCISGRMSSGN